MGPRLRPEAMGQPKLLAGCGQLSELWTTQDATLSAEDDEVEGVDEDLSDEEDEEDEEEEEVDLSEVDLSEEVDDEADAADFDSDRLSVR